MSDPFRISWISCVLSALLGVFALGPLESSAQETPNRKAAVRAVVEEIVGQPPGGLPCGSGSRVHIYNDVLDAGTAVYPFLSEDRKRETIVCSGSCLLFFIDWCPPGHFAHPVTIAVWDQDASGGELKSISADWWPIIRHLQSDGVYEEGIPVFNTVASRAYPNARSLIDGVTAADLHGTIVFDSSSREEASDPARSVNLRPAQTGSVSERGSTAKPGAGEKTVKAATAAPSPGCGVWAVIVDGETDKTDTFDEDAEGMYTVLRGHRVPKNQIYYLSPHFDAPEPCTEPTEDDPPSCPVPPGCVPPGPTDLRQRTSYCNLKNVLTEHLPDRIGAGQCDELLFFSSSHGGNGFLHCVLSEDWGGKIWRPYLDEWLARVPCPKVTVILEACHSGGFVEVLDEAPALSPPAPFPNQQRVIFASTTSGGVSLGDLDSSLDPNPGDIGSETIWGYIEAFGAGSADLPDGDGVSDGSISFEEAVLYAVKNDVSVLDPEYANEPVVFPDPPLTYRPHTCYPLDSIVDMTVRKPTHIENLDNDPLSIGWRPGSDYAVEIVVDNLGPSDLDVATLRVFSGQNPGPSQPWSPFKSYPWDQTQSGLWWPKGFQQIGETILFSNLGQGGSRTFQLEGRLARRVSETGEYTLLAVVDGPSDPVLTIRMPWSEFLKTDNNAAGDVLTVPPE